MVRSLSSPRVVLLSVMLVLFSVMLVLFSVARATEDGMKIEAETRVHTNEPFLQDSIGSSRSGKFQSPTLVVGAKDTELFREGIRLPDVDEKTMPVQTRILPARLYKSKDLDVSEAFNNIIVATLLCMVAYILFMY